MIASEHIVPAHYTTRPLQRALLHLTPWLAHRITVVSEQVMQQYPSMLRAKMVVVPNPIRLSVTSRADVTGRFQARKILLSVGRLTEQKDFATLIKAFAMLAGRHPEWDLRIVGEGELRPDLEGQIAEAGMEGRIFLPGATDNISAEYAASQLFVVSSLYESLGLALIEALAHGLPAVGFADCPGVNLLIQPGRNGALASGSDRASGLAETLVPLLASAQARQSLVAPITELPLDLDPERVLDCWEDVLHQCASTTH
jgi:glycosyltransferase involved in cell wall biosynthesis